MAGNAIVWEWKGCGESWSPYPPEVSNFIETSYEQWRLDSSKYGINLSAVSSELHYIDIDFSQSLAFHNKAGTSSILRRQLYNERSLAGRSVLWQWMQDSQTGWQCYTFDAAELLEISCANDVTIVDLDRPPCYLPYTVNLREMLQMRNKTQRKRPVRRFQDVTPYAREQDSRWAAVRGADYSFQQPNPNTLPTFSQPSAMGFQFANPNPPSFFTFHGKQSSCDAATNNFASSSSVVAQKSVDSRSRSAHQGKRERRLKTPVANASPPVTEQSKQTYFQTAASSQSSFSAWRTPREQIESTSAIDMKDEDNEETDEQMKDQTEVPESAVPDEPTVWWQFPGKILHSMFQTIKGWDFVSSITDAIGRMSIKRKRDDDKNDNSNWSLFGNVFANSSRNMLRPIRHVNFVTAASSTSTVVQAVPAEQQMTIGISGSDINDRGDAQGNASYRSRDVHSRDNSDRKIQRPLLASYGNPNRTSHDSGFAATASQTPNQASTSHDDRLLARSGNQNRTSYDNGFVEAASQSKGYASASQDKPSNSHGYGNWLHTTQSSTRKNTSQPDDFSMDTDDGRIRRHKRLKVGTQAVVQVTQSEDSVGVEDLLYEFGRLVAKPNKNESCCICMDFLVEPSGFGDATGVIKLNNCSHKFHIACLISMYDNGPKNGNIQCPSCKFIYGTKRGDCPKGTMSYCCLSEDLEGYPGCGCIRITYDIRDGTQNCQAYRARGFPRFGFLPNNEKGIEVLDLLIEAWQRRLTFTVGTSVTTGEQNVVVWNEIHHKTSMTNEYGHGYPDPNYLDNVLAELAAHGVTNAS